MNSLERVPAIRERLRERLLQDFSAFAKRGWKEIESKAFLWGWHHTAISEHLQAVFERRIRKLIVTVPPRCTKSRLASILFPAWVWSRDASQSIALTSYSDSLSEEFSVTCRALLQSEWYQRMFPSQVILSSDLNRKSEFRNTRGGTVLATSPDGVFTGKGADIIICDDLLNPQMSFSDLLREGVNRYFNATLRSRVNDASTACYVIIAQRLHECDIVGFLLDGEPGEWTHLSLEMECEKDTTIFLPISGRSLERKQGDLLHPQRFSKAWCEKTKATIGSYLWASQYQQRPAPLGGAIFKREWFRTYKSEPEKGTVVVSLDTAFSVKKGADFSVATVWRAHENKIYLLHVWRDRVEFPRLKQATEDLCRSWNAEVVLIEERGSGQSLAQTLREETSLPIVGIQPDVDKISRAHSVTSLFESGVVHFPEEAGAPWLPTLLHELELFPNSTHDDQVDSMVQALSYLRKQQATGGLTFLARMKERGEEWLKGNFRKSTPKAAPLAEATPAITRVEGGPPREKPGLCPVCNTKNLGIHPDGHRKTLCRQCAAVNGAVPAAKPTAGNICPVEGCGLPMVMSAVLRCQNHGQPPANGNPPNGVTFDQYHGRWDRFR